MTDNYGADPHHDNGHDDVLTPEHDAVREPPSDYEFADEHGASAAEEQTEESLTPMEVKPAGRSPLVPIAAAVGVLLLGGAAWWQFGGGSASVPQPQPNTVPVLTSAAMPVLATSPKTADAQPTTNTLSAPTPMPVPVAQGQTTSVSPVSPPTTAATPPVPLPSTPVPVASSLAPLPNAAVPGSPAAVASGTPPPSLPAETADQRIQALSTRIDELQKSLDQANQQLGQVTNMVAATAATASPSVKDLQDRIEKLEQELAQRSSAPVLAAPVTGTGGMVAVALPVTKKQGVHHKATAKTVVHKEVKKQAVAASIPTTSWVLRAASPGQAWVASSSTSRDFKQVQVGDSFEGIGKVTSIEQQDGSWVVKGTKGQIQ